MKPLRLLLPLVPLVFAIAAAVGVSAYAQDPGWKPPGTEEAAVVDRANATIDRVYKQLMQKLDAEGQKSLKEAQRAWIKWRDAEADLIARLGGAVGGSAFRVDYSNALAELIQQRTEALQGYLKDAEEEPR